MLVRFSLKNWMSFREETAFSMVASRERQHGSRLLKVKKYRIRLLPIATIFGGNAAGKSNVIKALQFIQKQIVSGTRNPDDEIQIIPYLLDNDSVENPSRFTLEIMIDKSIYEYSFSATRKEILTEQLIEITSAREIVLYKREKDKLKTLEMSDKMGSKDRERLNFIFEGTRNNQLFLTNAVGQNIKKLPSIDMQSIYDWFRQTLTIIMPTTQYPHITRLIEDAPNHYQTMNTLLSQLDTGIEHLDLMDMPEGRVLLPDQVTSQIKEGRTAYISASTGERGTVTRNNGVLTAKKLVAIHPKEDGSDIDFDLIQESDGTQRLIDLLPALIDLISSSQPKVYIIDELDRSLHTLLIKKLLKKYLSACNDGLSSQLLFTTHDLLLMDQDLLRRDEIWVAERNAGKSKLIAFSDYRNIRYDKDIRRSYLQGRFGGIPRILLESYLDES